MKEINDIVCFFDRKLYNFNEVINEFNNYYGLSVEEIKTLFNRCFVVEWETISSTLRDIGINNDDIVTRNFTYEFYYKSLSNLKNKGLELVELIEYLNGLKIINYNTLYESKLQLIDVSHFGSLLIGGDINRILIVMYHLLKEFNDTLAKINSIDTYVDYSNLINKSVIFVEGDSVYPNDSLIVYDNEDKNLLDKTSFIVRSNNKVKARMKLSN